MKRGLQRRFLAISSVCKICELNSAVYFCNWYCVLPLQFKIDQVVVTVVLQDVLLGLWRKWAGGTETASGLLQYLNSNWQSQQLPPPMELNTQVYRCLSEASNSGQATVLSRLWFHWLWRNRAKDRAPVRLEIKEWLFGSLSLWQRAYLDVLL